MGKLDQAELAYRQSLAIRRKAVGESHPAVALGLSNLAHLYCGTANFVQAEPFFQQALDIRGKSLGKHHPDYASSLNNMAGLYVATGRAAEALPFECQGAAIDDRMIGQVFSIGSESQRIAFLNQVRARMNMFLSVVWQHLGQAPDAVRAALDLVLRRKVIGAECLAAQRDALLGGKFPALEAQLQELTNLRRQIAQKTLAGPSPKEGLQAHQ